MQVQQAAACCHSGGATTLSLPSHWPRRMLTVACRWNLDSQLPAPASFACGDGDGAEAASDGGDGDGAVAESDGGAARLLAFLRAQLQAGAHLLLVTRQSSSSPGGAGD